MLNIRIINCFHRKEGKVTIERTLPDTITDWVGYTACISPIHGLGIAPPTTITAFQSFFLDYSLPYSVKRGEMFRMKVSLFNYMQHSLPVINEPYKWIVAIHKTIISKWIWHAGEDQAGKYIRGGFAFVASDSIVLRETKGQCRPWIRAKTTSYRGS